MSRDKPKKVCINLIPRVPRLFGQWVGARRDSGEFEKNLNFLIGCSGLAPQQLPLFYLRNPAVIKFQYPRVSPGKQLLAKEPEDSGYEIVSV